MGKRDQDEEKPKKPKNVAQITMTVRDDGKVAGDFWIWEIDELDRNKKWTVSGEDLFRFLAKIQPATVKMLASTLNAQIAVARLPIEMQGGLVTMKDDGALQYMESKGDQMAKKVEDRQSKEMGLKG